MGYVKYQSKLTKLPRKRVGNPVKPRYPLNWEKRGLTLKKFILLHLIRVVDDYRSPYFKLTMKKLISDLSKNMGGIVKLQVKIYVENLVYYGYIAESYVGGIVTVTDKAYDELYEIDKILSNQNKEPRGT